MNIIERLKRLEANAKRLFVSLYPPDDDGFCHALVGDQAEQYQRGEGYDIMQALNDTAVQDWAEAPETM